MRKLALVSSVVLGALMATRGPLQAQDTATDEAVVVAAAVSHMVQVLRENDGVPAGEVRLDPRVLESREIANPASGTPVPVVTVYELSGTRRESVTASALLLSGTSLGTFDNARRCETESLRSCTLRDGVAVLASSNPMIHADSAEVLVKAIWLGTLAKAPVQDGVFRITLQRDGSGWKAVATRALQIS